MIRHCFALDLKNDKDLIAEYEDWHKKVWPEILSGIRDSGIEALEIYRYANRLFMIMVVSESFSFEVKAKIDAESTVVQKWEELMWQYQQSIPGAKPGEKWVMMNKIFTL
jgi:L-rhamnose mutarotase